MAANARVDRVPPLFGREEVRKRILEGLRAAQENRGSLLILEGDEGVGKTTLLRTTAADARRLGFRILEDRGVPTDAPEPFGLIRRLTRAAPPAGHGPSSTDEPRPLGGLSFLLAPAPGHGGPLIEHPGEGRDSRRLDGGDDPLLASLAAPDVRPEEGYARVRDGLSGFFVGLAGKSPVLLLLDDAEFADEESLDFLLSFAHGGVPHPIFVLLAKGTGSARPSARWPNALVSTGAEPPRIRVPTLNASELADYARWLLPGRELSPETLHRWFAQTQGNPRFVARIVRRSTGGTHSPSSNAPEEGPDDVPRLPVQALSSEDRRILLHAAVLGREFDFATLHAALGGEDRLALAEALERLARAGFLREREDEAFGFVRDSARAELYQGLTESLRRILHRKAARAIESRAHGENATLYELARQYYLAQDDAKSVEFNQRAAERSAAAFAFRDAAVHYERALESARRLSPRDPSREIRLLVELGRVLGEPLGEVDHAERVLEEAVTASRLDPRLEGERALALLYLARHTVNRGLNESGRALAQEALELFERKGNRLGILTAHRTLGLAAIWLSDFASAETHLLRALALAEAEGDRAQQGVVLVELANALITPGPARGEEALGYYDRAAELLTPTGDFAALARLRMNQAWILEDSGRADEARATIAAACELAERAGSRYWMGWCAMVEALILTNRDRRGEAERSLERAHALLGPLDDRIANQQLAWIGGMLAQKSGRWSEAREKYDRALDEARRLGVRAEVALVLFRIAHLAFAEGRTEVAREFLRQALDADVESLHAEVRSEVADLKVALGL